MAAAPHLGARAQAQPGRAHQARQAAARDPRRAARADRRRATRHVAEEDIVRLQWWGLYHDKPKIGTFMLRVKVPAGMLTPAKLRDDRRGLEPLRPRRRRAHDAAEHPAPLARAREAARRLRPPRRRRASRPPAAAATPCATSPAAPSQGIAADELFDATPIVDAATADLLRQPRLGEPAAQAQVLDRAPAPTAATRPRSTASR